MSIELAPTNAYRLTLRNPIMVAAGCLGYGVERAQRMHTEMIGALVTPTTQPQQRTQPPILLEFSGGLFVHGRWVGQRIDRVIDRYNPIWANWSVPVLLSIAGISSHMASELAAYVTGVEGLAGIELECAELDSAEAVASVVKAVRGATMLPLVVKLPAQPLDLVAVAQAAAHAGADALVVSAAVRGQWFDTDGQPMQGWLCGPGQHPLALARVSLVAAAVEVPIIGSGGIVDAAGVARMLAAGAHAVQIGSALLADPGLASRLAREFI